MSLPVPTTHSGGGGGGIGGGSAGVNVDPRQLAAMEAPLMALANASGGDVRKLLYGFFSFLNRRTDFYVVHPAALEDGNNKDGSSAASQAYSMGFKEGDAEKLLLASFRQFPLRRLPANRPPQQPQQQQAADSKAPPSAPAKSGSQASQATKQGGQATSHADEGSDSTGGGGATRTTAAGSPTANASSVRRTEEGLQIPVGNGGSASRYEWTQTLDECTVLVPLPERCRRAKDLAVDLCPTALSVRPKKISNEGGGEEGDKGDGGSGSSDAIVSGTLTERIVPSESTWTIEGGVLVVLLHKAVPTFWRAVLEGDDEIDTTLVDARRHIGEYDEETQAKLRKIMFDEQQLRRGLPTSDEILGIQPPPPIPTIPTLPPGVEYIDQAVLNQSQKARKDGPPP